MKAYIFNYTIAAAILTVMYIGIFYIIAATIAFLTWSLLPLAIYLALLRAAVFMGLFTAIIYISSPEGRQALRTVEAIWK